MLLYCLIEEFILKIIVYTNNFPQASQTFVFDQVMGLKKLGHDVAVLTNKSNIQRIDEIDIKSLFLFKNRIKFFSFIISIFQLLKLVISFSLYKKINVILSDESIFFKEKILILMMLVKYGKGKLSSELNIVHFGTNAFLFLKMKELGLISGKVAVIFHGFELSRFSVLDMNRIRYRYVFDNADTLLPVSDKWKEKLIELGACENKLSVLRMGIDPSEFEFDEHRYASLRSKDVIQLTQVGRLTEKKAILDTIRALSIIVEKLPVNLNIVGDGELLETAKNLVEELSLSKYIKFHGRVPHKEVNRILDFTDVFLLPSKVAPDGDQEGVPVSLMEAMAKGILCISTYHSGIPELIKDNYSGFLVPEGDYKAIAEKIVDFSQLSSTSKRNMAINAKITIDNNFVNIENINIMMKRF